MQAVTDGLSRLFGAHDPLSRWVRNRGMAAVNRLGGLKRLLAQPALRLQLSNSRCFTWKASCRNSYAGFLLPYFCLPALRLPRATTRPK